jgi:hypothetical protein
MADARSGWIALGAVNAALAVAAGAFAAHGLRERLDARALEVFETGARYQMYHALAMIAVGLAVPGRHRAVQRLALRDRTVRGPRAGPDHAARRAPVPRRLAVAGVVGLARLADPRPARPRPGPDNR